MQGIEVYGLASGQGRLIGERDESPTFDERAADQFEHLRQAKVRIGTMDLKIACIALVNDALLLSANRRDFGQVPGLRLESWLHN